MCECAFFCNRVNNILSDYLNVFKITGHNVEYFFFSISSFVVLLDLVRKLESLLIDTWRFEQKGKTIDYTQFLNMYFSCLPKQYNNNHIKNITIIDME